MSTKTIKAETLAALINVGPHNLNLRNNVIDTYLHLAPLVEQANSTRELCDTLGPVIQNLVTAHVTVQLLIGKPDRDCHLIFGGSSLDCIGPKLNQDEYGIYGITRLTKIPAVTKVLSDANRAVCAINLLIDDFAHVISEVMIDEPSVYKGDVLNDMLFASCRDVFDRLDAAKFIDANDDDNKTEDQLLVTKQLQSLVLA